ncbi:fibronectin type III domain-containing protein [Corallibacter sp.]|uniref:fibronectin type III domain-containing protein n=1 Tax=Corallibacter sp. TaxID=2038084 RepID=UPI003A911B50
MKKFFYVTLAFLTMLSCAKDDDGNIVPIPFQNCLQPHNLDASSITTTSAVIEWSDRNDSNFFNLEFGLNGFQLGTGSRINVNSDNVQLIDLEPNTPYDFYVRSNCGGNDYSDWSGPSSFVTD